ncbi:C45 family peptidase [Bdellovibrionota bacterium FG-2]
MNRTTLRSVHFIRLKGDQVTRARAHGRLLQEEISQGPLAFLGCKNESIIRHATGPTQFKPLQNAVVKLYKRVFLPILSRQFTLEEKNVLKGFAESAGISEAVCRESILQPDVLMLLCRTSLVRHLIPEWPTGGIPGCTSAIAPASWTRSGRMLIGRNMDYPVVGPWESQTLVTFHEPEGGKEIPHVSVSSAGVMTSGLTSINREGITLSAHAHFGKDVSLRGRTILSIGTEIIGKAKNLNQVIDLCRKTRRIGNWSLVVSSARDQAAAVIEMSAHKTHVWSPDDGAIAHSNYFHTPELQATEALLSGGAFEDFHGRVSRIQSILGKKRGVLEPQDFCSALGDQRDCVTGEERVVGGTVGVVTTVKSVVMEPASQKLWVSCRGESPTGLGDFLEVDINKFWDQDFSSSNPPPALHGYLPQSPKLLEGIRFFREAYQHFHMFPEREDYAERALRSMHKAIHAFPADGHLWMQAAILAFQLTKFDEARGLFEEAGKHSLSEHTRHVRKLFLARCCDILGDRKRAVSIYRDHADVKEPRLRAALKKGARTKFRAKDARAIMIDLQFPDPMQY